MKKSMLILLLMFLMSSCEGVENPQKIGENQPVQTTQETLAATVLTTAETSVIREKTTTVSDFKNPAEFQDETKFFEESTAEFSEIQPTTESQTTVTVSENAEEKEFADPEESALTTAKIPETQPKTESQTTVTVSENAKEKEAAESVTTAVQAEAEVEEIPDISQENDYEKAWEIYSYMRENGSGTCVNYACQTYEMCQEVGLPCYIVWTENQLCGHVANTVKIGDIWYILDAQGGYFLDYNYGFTEVVDIDGNHIADGDILSDHSYDELN